MCAQDYDRNIPDEAAGAVDVVAEVRREEALLKTGALQNAIFNSANFSSIATDENGVIQIFNVGAERMLGYAAADVVNKITPADISDSQEVIARAKALSVELATPITPGFEALVFKAARGIEDIYELTYIRKDGSRFPAIVSVTALRDAQEKIIGYLLIGTDNTARRQAEEALREAGALQNAIFNSANFSSIATDEKGVIQIFNVGAERMLGWAAAEVMNKITPADISDPQEVIARAEALSTELDTPITPGFEALVFKASRGIEDIYELTYIRKDGSRFPAIVSVTALRDAQGVIIGYLLIGTDNTVRKQVEAEQKKLDQRLRDQQFYTRSLIESNIDALMTTDPAGIITDVNKQMEALTGCTRDELIGAPFKNYFTDPPLAEAGIKKVLREKKVNDYELTARARDGKTTVVSYNATTFYDRDRTLQGVFVAARDVTERKRIEQMLQEKNVELESAVERLQEVDRLKQGFLSTVSHELRTPLTSIRGSLGLLASGAVGDLSGEVLEVVAIAERNAVRLVALINDILDLERLETGKIELQFGQVPVESVLRRAIDSLATFGQEHGVTVEAPEVSSTIWADADRIVQVLVNLLSNAVKFSPPAGVVTIGVRPAEGWVEFRVTDRGRGVPAAYRRAIFERFRQVETSDAREKGGTGLGLAICKSIIEQHGGMIGVEGEEGCGSTFWFRIATAPRPIAPRLGRAILVCSDDAERRGFFEDVIRQAGYTVVTVPDADAAWEVLQGGDVAVVLLKCDSELIARIRKDPTFEAVPVILFGSPVVVSPGASSDNLVLFLPERVDSRQLLAAIRDGLERGRVVAQARYVLLVEDDLTLLDVMARQLAREGITVRNATTGKEAIRIAEAEPPALMVLDVGLPEHDGFDVVDAMRQRPELRDIPVLVYTGRDLTEEQRGRLRLGPTRFLTKSKASDEDFRRLVVELRKVPPARGAETVTGS
jgi:PAS domain S-box-containing protein